MDREQNTDYNVNGIYEIEINRVPIKWDITKGSLSFFGIDSALFQYVRLKPPPLGG